MKNIIKQIKNLTKGHSTLNIGEDTFMERIILNLGEKHEVHLYAIHENGVDCFVCGEDIETVLFTLPFEVLSIEVLREVLENVKEAQSFIQ